jgi:hypothetical protein
MHGVKSCKSLSRSWFRESDYHHGLLGREPVGLVKWRTRWVQEGRGRHSILGSGGTSRERRRLKEEGKLDQALETTQKR